MGRPWRAVVGELVLRSGRGARWWAGTLSCGHRFERPVRYRRLHDTHPDVLPPPKRVRCEECGDA